MYLGSRGVTMRRVTPYAVDDVRFEGFCHLRHAERSFWVRKIESAEVLRAAK